MCLYVWMHCTWTYAYLRASVPYEVHAEATKTLQLMQSSAKGVGCVTPSRNIPSSPPIDKRAWNKTHIWTSLSRRRDFRKGDRGHVCELSGSFVSAPRCNETEQDRPPRKCTRKGIGGQSVVSKHRNCLRKEPMPCRPMPLLVRALTLLDLRPPPAGLREPCGVRGRLQPAPCSWSLSLSLSLPLSLSLSLSLSIYIYIYILFASLGAH